MNIDRRDFLAGGAGVAGLLALAACSSSGSGGSGKAGSNPDASPSASGGPMGKFSGQNLVLSRWSGDPWTSGQKEAAKQWGQATGGSVKISDVPYENLHDKQALTLSGAGGYDMLYVHPSWFGEFAKAGYLAPVDAFLSDSKRNPAGFSATSYVPNVYAQGLYQGKHYGLPDFVSTIVLAYRKDLLSSAGIATPGTTDDIIAAAKALNGKNGMAGIVLPGKATGAVADVMGTLLTAQGNWWYDAKQKPSLDPTAATAAVQFYVDAAKSAPKGLLNDAVDDAATIAAQGKSAMVISTTPSLQALEDPSKSSTAGKWGYAPLAMTSGKPAGELIYWMWCIAAKSKHQDAAYSFLQWYTDTAQQAVIAVQAGTAGATTSFYKDSTVTSKLPFLPALNQALTTTNPQPSLPTWPKAQNDIEVAVQNAILGKSTVAEAVSGIQKALTAALGS
jgi:multiple sugar transport system substrate-binding protein